MLCRLWFASVTLFVGCTGMMQGPPIDLAEVAAPEPPKTVQPTTSVQVPAPPVLPRGTFRAWEVARQAEDGTMTEGRWITIRTTAPPVQQLEPEKLIPRAPHRVTPSKPSKDAARTPPPPPGVPPTAPPAPPGMPEHLSGIPGMQQVIEQLQRTRQAPPGVGGP